MTHMNPLSKQHRLKKLIILELKNYLALLLCLRIGRNICLKLNYQWIKH